MATRHDQLEGRYQLAREIAKEAGEVTLRYFQQQVDVERKSDGSPVTIADREAERHLRKRIENQFPDDAILGEEYGERAGTSGYRWILDPIDGTKSFVVGVPLYTTLVAVLHNDEPQIGVIGVPALGEQAHARIGYGAWHERPGCEPVRAVVSSNENLADAVFVTSERKTFDERDAAETYKDLESASWLTRTWGDAFGYLLLATGRVDLMVDPILNVWDAAAVSPVVTEAGGSFTDWQGEPTIFAGESIGTNGHILPEVLQITRKAKPIENG